MKLTHASVFSGIGGPEIAATMLGWDNAFHCEINDFGRKILEYWFPKSESYKDVKTTNFTKWRGRIDVLTGGFPCQPFSYAGQRRGADDDRYLWPEFKRVISEIRPTWVVGENVAGITTMVEQGKVATMEGQASLFDESDGVCRYKYEQPFTIQRVCADLEALQYSVQPFIIPACAVGAPHRRDRVFIVARHIASDTDNGADRRTAREDEGKGREERIQERHEVRKSDEPNQVRPEAERFTTDTCSNGRPPQDIRRKRERRTSDGKNVEQPQSVFDSGSIRRNPADTSCECCQRLRPRQSEAGGAQQEQPRGRGGEDGGVAGCGRWANFPTVSPVHRGNDGLPFDVDRLALSFGKWRTEALKAYGNAIVPQVMYEIFRAIEIVEQENL